MPEPTEATIEVLREAVTKIEARLSDGMKAMIAEQRSLILPATLEQQAAHLEALHVAVTKIDTTINNGLKGMVVEHKTQLHEINEAVQRIRDQVNGHIAKEDVIFEIFRKTLSVGVAFAGTLVLTLFGIIGWLLTHENTWIR
jgi:hypothetical protein